MIVIVNTDKARVQVYAPESSTIEFISDIHNILASFEKFNITSNSTFDEIVTSIEDTPVDARCIDLLKNEPMGEGISVVISVTDKGTETAILEWYGSVIISDTKGIATYCEKNGLFYGGVSEIFMRCKSHNYHVMCNLIALSLEDIEELQYAVNFADWDKNGMYFLNDYDHCYYEVR